VLYVEKQEDTILLRMSHSAFFDSGRITIDSDTEQILREVCTIIEEYTDLIASVQIEGHTDNVPISSKKFADNWDLSVLRATSVLRFISKNMDTGDTVLKASGYGELYPIASNDTDDGRAQNRRVDFIIVSIIED
jgi:chemotaxis protein MotB